MKAFLKDIFCDDKGRASAKRVTALALVLPFVFALYSPAVSEAKLYTIAGLISALLISSTIEKFNNQPPTLPQ
jgi:hypothetical protein